MKRALLVASALIASAWTAEAGAAPKDSVVRISVDRPEHYSRMGSGVVVSRDPPIVATCAHVVAGRRDVWVYMERYDRYVRVVKASADFTQDIAFLLVDTNVLPAFADAATWDQGYSFPDQRSAEVDMYFIGYSRRTTSRTVRGKLMGTLMTLRALGSFPSSVGGGDDMTVFELDDENHVGMIGFGGDSGAPVFVGERVVGLVAGFIDLNRGHSRRIPFGVPAKRTIPGAEDMKSLPLPNIDPYAAFPVVKSVWEPSYEGVLVNDQAAPCMAPLETTMGQYRGRRDKLPSSLEGSPAPECQDLYAALRRDAIIEERDARLQREVLGSASMMAAIESAWAKDRKKRDEELKRSLSPDLQKGFEGLLEVGRDVEPAPPAAPPGKAQELLLLASKYKQSAEEARKRQEELLRTGVAPKAATPPVR